MKKIYFFLTFVTNYFLNLYLIIRIIRKKECPIRYKEKLCQSLDYRKEGFLIWFHCSSIGELKSVFSIIDYYLNDKKNQILVTTSTLGSNEVFKKKYEKVENIIHQYAPFDTPQIVKKFFLKWKPNIIFFTESEIWPNQILEAKNKNIPIILLNGRLSPGSFNRWKLFKDNMKEILNCFNIILCQSKESKNSFSYFDTNNIEYIGNLKFVISKEYESKNYGETNLQRLIFIALSTHETEEEFCARVHLFLKEKHPTLLTIIIPRHVRRAQQINDKINKLKLNSIISNSLNTIEKKTDIMIINTYGITKKFLELSKYVFIGGSLINRGGQNPIEAAYNNSIIFHGPYVYNFKEIYKLLEELNISFEIKSEADLVKILDEKLVNYKNPNTKDSLIKIGDGIFEKTIRKINKYMNA
jgi:3-deoxy-D-manno-octulosonic-acid transferase